MVFVEAVLTITVEDGVIKLTSGNLVMTITPEQAREMATDLLDKVEYLEGTGTTQR